MHIIIWKSWVGQHAVKWEFSVVSKLDNYVQKSILDFDIASEKIAVVSGHVTQNLGYIAIFLVNKYSTQYI